MASCSIDYLVLYHRQKDRSRTEGGITRKKSSLGGCRRQPDGGDDRRQPWHQIDRSGYGESNSGSKFVFRACQNLTGRRSDGDVTGSSHDCWWWKVGEDDGYLGCINKVTGTRVTTSSVFVDGGGSGKGVNGDGMKGKREEIE
ncbi:hypothetical protein AgCh_032236 [Apium graveolens]